MSYNNVSDSELKLILMEFDNVFDVVQVSQTSHAQIYVTKRFGHMPLMRNTIQLIKIDDTLYSII